MWIYNVNFKLGIAHRKHFFVIFKVLKPHHGTAHAASMRKGAEAKCSFPFSPVAMK